VSSDPLQIDADHIAYWLGDLFVIYVEKKNASKQLIKL
jgi:hypothetical protein